MGTETAPGLMTRLHRRAAQGASVRGRSGSLDCGPGRAPTHVDPNAANKHPFAPLRKAINTRVASRIRLARLRTPPSAQTVIASAISPCDLSSNIELTPVCPGARTQREAATGSSSGGSFSKPGALPPSHRRRRQPTQQALPEVNAFLYVSDPPPTRRCLPTGVPQPRELSESAAETGPAAVCLDGSLRSAHPLSPCRGEGGIAGPTSRCHVPPTTSGPWAGEFQTERCSGPDPFQTERASPLPVAAAAPTARGTAGPSTGGSRVRCASAEPIAARGYWNPPSSVFHVKLTASSTTTSSLSASPPPSQTKTRARPGVPADAFVGPIATNPRLGPRTTEIL